MTSCVAPKRKKFHLEKYGVTSLVTSIFHLFQLFLKWWVRIYFSTASQLKCGDFHVYPVVPLPQPFYGPFSGTTQVSQCQKRTSGLYGARKINRGRHTDHLAGRHSSWTNQCPPPPSPHIFLQAGCPSCRPTNSVKALKATGTFGLGRRRKSSPQRCYLHRIHTLL